MAEYAAHDGYTFDFIHGNRLCVYNFPALDEAAFPLVDVSPAWLRCDSGRLGDHIYLVSHIRQLVHKVHDPEIWWSPNAQEGNSRISWADTWGFCYGRIVGVDRFVTGNQNLYVQKLVDHSG